MKKLRLLIPILLISLLLSGCGYILPYFIQNFASLASQEEYEEELPIGSDVDSKLSADDIYYRSKFAATERALHYRENATVTFVFDEDDFPVDMHYDTTVTLDPDSSAVNIQTQLSFPFAESHTFWDYYRDEDGRLAHYSYDEETGECFREVIDLDGQTPYTVILSFSEYGYPYAPENLTVDPQTRILNEREVYMLTFEQSALDTFGYTGSSVRDTQLSRRSIPITWYVDAETFLPVQKCYTLTQIDDLLGDVISSLYYLDEEGAVVYGYRVTFEYLSFDPVEVEPIPQEVYRKSWENSGFSAN